MAAALLRLAWCASTATALFVHPGAGNTATLKPPVIDPFNPFGTPAEDPMHGHSVAASHLTTDHLDVLARLASKLKHMRLEDIEQVVVIGLSDHDLELQVMTCSSKSWSERPITTTCSMSSNLMCFSFDARRAKTSRWSVVK